jgi:ketosteroid isomerase-like protein
MGASMATAQMSCMEIGTALLDFCKQGKNDEAMTTLYADDIVSVEAGGPPGMDRTIKGRDAVVAKSKWWTDNHIVHSAEMAGPWPNGDQFVTTFKYDVTFKPENKRFVMEEAALYTVRDGKIVKEEFFYNMG